LELEGKYKECKERLIDSQSFLEDNNAASLLLSTLLKDLEDIIDSKNYERESKGKNSFSNYYFFNFFKKFLRKEHLC